TGDYGDAPLSYGSPVHSILAGTYLGSAVPDAETSTQASTAANGDDTHGTDDEDGITIPALTAGQTSTLMATVAGTGGYLQAWFDWNGDGDFADSGEQVATNLQDGSASDVNSSAGIIGFNVTVPITAVTGNVYARFRWSTVQGLDPIAAASNGEVEDYVATVAPALISISGKVWFDSSQDGIQNEGADAGITGAKVELFNPATNAVVATTTTDVNGAYQFSSSVAAATAYQVRIAQLEAAAPQSDWAITTAKAGTNPTLDSDATLSGSNWIIAVTSPTAGNSSNNDFGFILVAPEGCLNNSLLGTANDSLSNSHPNAYDFSFNNKLVSGYCTEKADADPLNNDSYQVNLSDRQNLTDVQRGKLARLYSALQDPDIIFALAPVTTGGKQQQRLDDLMTYMTWYYTYFGENLASVVSNHIDSNSNFTADQRTVMKALMQKIIDRVAGTNGEPQYPAQSVYWLWNMTSSSRQDIIVPARFVIGQVCSSTGTITGKVYKDLNG
ncbi:MAG TPA: SdrD B-like domain-containing protein, partial [Thiolinea sp.]|nr:SdrD B-like domain-containing protein [Thiolinea sp.]